MRIPKKLFVVLSDSHIRYEWLLLYMTRLALWLKILRHCYGVFIHFEQVLAHCESVRDSTWRNEKTFEMNKSYKNNKKIYSNLAIVLLSINKFSRHSSAISVDFKDSLFYKFIIQNKPSSCSTPSLFSIWLRFDALLPSIFACRIPITDLVSGSSSKME